MRGWGELVRSVVLAALVAACGPGGGAASDDRPDVLLISLDSVRADALDFRDPEAAPNLAELARRGTVFDQAVSGTSWTLPAHAQMLTGAPPVLHGVQSDDVRLDPAMPTLAELLHAAGWTTAGFFTGSYLWGDFGFARGFDVYRSAMTAADLERPDASHAPRGEEALERGEDLREHAFVSSPHLVESVRRALEDVDPDRPLFLFAHLFDPHYDYIPPPPWDTRFDPDYEGEIDGHGYWNDTRIWDETKDPPRRIGDRDLEHVVALYRGEIGWTDAAVGRILDLLRRRGRLDRTLIVVTADHGEEFFEHGRRGHRQSLFEEVLRVPLLIVPPADPGVGSRARAGELVSLSDVVPTILDYAGLPAPPSVHGRSLRAAMHAPPASDEDRALVTCLYTWNSDGPRTRHSLLHGLRTPREKLLRLATLAPDGSPRVRQVLWYDLERDPLERSPVSDRSDPRLQAAWHRLEDELDAIRARWRELGLGPDDARRTDVSSTFLDQLQALGYAEGGADANRYPAHELPWGLGPPPRLDLPQTEDPR